mmetsp:Transcript_42875/g.79967  ORF Transcript_42875/g.79967 Transcript_42875/m.79967 type:complete len:341 (-) Transcript_42875:45-1067(-)
MPKKTPTSEDKVKKGKKRSLEAEEAPPENKLVQGKAKKQKVAKEVASQKACKLYVAGIPRKCDETSIRDHFAEHGAVLEVQMPPDKPNKASKRIAFVSFADPQSAEAALAANGDVFEGSKLTVQLAVAKGDTPAKSAEPAQVANATKVFVTGFGRDTEAIDSLKEHFSSKCGEISSFSLPSSKSAKAKGAVRGFAIVEFSKEKFASKALKLNGTKFDGKTIVVKQYTKSAADEKQIQKQAVQKKQKEEKEKALKEFRVVVKGFPKATTQKELREHFASCGDIRSVSLPQKDGSSRGIAFISFDSEAALKAALAFSGQDFKDTRKLEVWKALRKDQSKKET